MLLVEQSDRAIGERLSAELAEVENRFAAELASDLSCVNDLVKHIELYRGKMLRPMLLLVSGLASAGEGSDITDDHRTVAAVVEMVHMATLVHDDVLDEARIRRGGSTINGLRGNETAVMLGDFLISHSYHLCSSLDSAAVSRIIAQATNIVCEGELLQLANRNNWDLDEQTYYQIIRRKTASLCGTCCRLGALLHDDPMSSHLAAATLYEYGEKVGIAFQIIDDLLDLVGDPATVGKTLGRDLEKGKLTLPLIHHLGTPDAGPCRALLQRHDDSDGQEIARAVRQAIHASGSVQYANDQAARLIEQAKVGLGRLPSSPGRQVLSDIADAVLTRKF